MARALRRKANRQVARKGGRERGRKRESRLSALTNSSPIGSPAPVATLANLCVDVLANVDELPSDGDTEARIRLHEYLKYSSTSCVWECGGAANFAITATRLGLRSTCVGHTGEDAFGNFLLRSLEEEGIVTQQLSSLQQRDDGYDPSSEPRTLVCYVLRDKDGQHGFISRVDFTDEPVLNTLTAMPPGAAESLRGAGMLNVNGFVFDELLPECVVDCLADTRENVGVPILFDPGPRAEKLLNDMPKGGAMAIDWLLKHSDVLLLTRAEAEAVTNGLASADAAAEYLLQQSYRSNPWVIVKLGADGALLMSRDRAEPLQCAGFSVPVRDEVGCGDSFAAAIALAQRQKLDGHAALALANAVGAATASSIGAGRNVASAGMVLQLLEQRIAKAVCESERAAAKSALHALESSLALAPF